MKAIAEK